jgi:hypothetical protein
MKRLLQIIALLTLTVTAANAAETVEAGPRKGRMLNLGNGKTEFFVEADRKVSFAFYDAENKQRPTGSEVMTTIAEAPSGKKTLEFEKQGDLLVSKEPLPEGEHYNVVVQARENAEAKPKNFRIKLDLSICGSCSNPEYACTCDE